MVHLKVLGHFPKTLEYLPGLCHLAECGWGIGRWFNPKVLLPPPPFLPLGRWELLDRRVAESGKGLSGQSPTRVAFHSRAAGKEWAALAVAP